MPHRVGEICEKCHKHMHPRTVVAFEEPRRHSPEACSSCLPLGAILFTCGGCKLTRYCGKACQIAHRPIHRTDCEDNIRVKHCVRSCGSEIQAKHAAYSQWCENNSPAFATAAFAALGISSPLDRQKAYEYILFVVVSTDSVKDDQSDKLKFTHSILLATKLSRQFVHDNNDITMGSPETVDRVILSPSTYTLTWILGRDSDLYHINHPDWFENLKKGVK